MAGPGFRSLVFAVASALLLAQPAPARDPGDPLSGLERLKKFQAQRASSSDPDWRSSNNDAGGPLGPGETRVLGDLKGPGIITHFWNTVPAQERYYSRLVVVRMYWDGETTPSVEAPLGDFFGVGHGMDVAFESLPVTVVSDGRARNCYWPMPFRKSARVTVTNEGTKAIHGFYYYLDWQKHSSLDPDTAYFHAQYRQEFPCKAGQNYLIADIRGQGHYVGTVLSCNSLSDGWWGEGDDFFFIDGESEPGLRGTGTEDYFCDAWGFRQQSGPYFGAPLWEGNEPTGARTSVYRWHIADPVPFRKSLRLEIEHKGVGWQGDGTQKSGFEERFDNFSSVAFWYQKEPHKPFPLLPTGTDRLTDDYASIIEGESLLAKATATSGPIERQDLPGCSGGGQLWWRPAASNQVLTIPFDIKEDGKYNLVLALTSSWDYGSCRLDLDGEPLGEPFDFYSASVTTRNYHFGVRELKAGTHKLTVTGTGKNAASKDYFFGLDGIIPTKK